MKIFDMHIHSERTERTPGELIAKMEKLGVYGGCVFSDRPERGFDGRGSTFEERIEQALGWCKGYEDRLFPIVWIDPFEENIIENVRKAVKMGICGFKMMCTDYFVYEEKSIELLKEIAKLNVPVIFHTGILWTEKASSVYNRPLNWEGLLTIEGLRFSMGHCSWPWLDECVALFGEFMSTGTMRKTAEMFLDTTPGTPRIYRKEMFYKFYNAGYDVGDNILYGTDSTAHVYKKEFVENIVENDKPILQELGISKANIEKLYYKNLLRFLGKTEVEMEHFRPEPDMPTLWDFDNKEVYKIIEDNSGLLDLPAIYKKEFEAALTNMKISDIITPENYNYDCDDPKRNLLSGLFLCDEMKKRYREKEIPEEIYKDTASDINILAARYLDATGELGVKDLSLFRNHLTLKLFRLGRLNFCMSESEYDIPSKNLKKGDKVIQIYIPEGDSLTPEKCISSIEKAKEFFKKYFPDFDYKCFVCHSWLLDRTLKDLLPEQSNILKFAEMFDIISEEKSDDILTYVFKCNTTRYSLRNAAAETSFAKNIKEAVKEGREFFKAFGVMK